MTKYKFAKEIEDFLNVLKDAGGFGIEDMEPIEARNLDLIEQESPEVKGVVEIGADGPFGPIPMYDYTPIGAPENKALPAIIFYHGGGWVIGSRDGHDSLCRYLSNTTGCRVFSVGYRLAPEFKFPVPIDESFTALKFISDNSEELNIDKSKIVVAGDSAGGNIAAVMSLMARDKKDLNVSYQLLIYPATDASKERASYEENGKGFLLEKEGMRWFYKHYLANDKDRKDWRVSPILAPDLSNLPPSYIITVAADPLRDEGRDYVEALRKAGNEVEHIEYDDVIHAFFSWPLAMNCAKKAVDAAGKAIKKAVG